MKRSSFLKSLIVAIVSPKIIIEASKKSPLNPPTATSNLFNDLNFIAPDYIESFQRKYSPENWTALLQEMNFQPTNFIR